MYNALGGNQFASGGFLLMVIGGVMAILRKIPETLWKAFLRQVTITVTVKDEDAAFDWVKQWFVEQPFTKKCRFIDLQSSRNLEDGIYKLPAPGRHWFRYKKKFLFVDFVRTQESKGWAQKRTETFYLTFIGRNKDIISEFIKEVVSIHNSVLKESSRLLKFSDSYWRVIYGYSGRVLDSVILADGQKEALLFDINQFLGSKEKYTNLGIPYHRGYLLYGPAGTGKSSLASSLATHYGMSLYVINLSQFSDKNLVLAMNSVGRNSIILFEDIDVMSATADREKKVNGDTPATGLADVLGVTMSGLLNVLDGIDAPSDVLFIMTTNKEDDLDPALIRPGRIDYQLHLGLADTNQKVQLYLRFFPSSTKRDAEEFITDHSELKTMAELQGYLLDFAKDRNYLEAVV